MRTLFLFFFPGLLFFDGQGKLKKGCVAGSRPAPTDLVLWFPTFSMLLTMTIYLDYISARILGLCH
jgi:hypothetical protein